IKEDAIRGYLSGMVELAAAKNHAHLVSYLLNTYPDIVRTHSEIQALGYWLCIQDDKANYEKIKNNNAHVALTLKQLEGHGSFSKVYQASLPEQQNLYLGSQYKAEKLSPVAKKTYRLARFSKASSLLD